MWAIPIYSSDPKQHDQIVGKDGAFETLMNVVPIFAMSASQVQIRTVILQQITLNFQNTKFLSLPSLDISLGNYAVRKVWVCSDQMGR